MEATILFSVPKSVTSSLVKEMVVQKPQYVADACGGMLMILKGKDEMATIEGLSTRYQKVKPH